MSKIDNSKTIEYFEKREAAKLKKELIKISKLEKYLKKEYKKTLDAISKEVAFLVSKYASNNNLTFDEANKLLTSKEFKEFRYDLKTYIKLIEETGDEALLLELNTLSMKKRISRLEHIYYQVDKLVDELIETSENSLQMLFTDTLANNYYETMYDIHKYMGIASSFSLVDDKLIKDILSYPWSGRDYSKRIWSNRTKLKEALREELTQMCIQGKSIKETSKALSKRLNAHYKNCERLIHTEHSYIMTQASQKAYEETGLEKYQILATLDKRTSEICQRLDGEVFYVKDGIVGKTLPPFH